MTELKMTIALDSNFLPRFLSTNLFDYDFLILLTFKFQDTEYETPVSSILIQTSNLECYGLSIVITTPK